MKSKAWMMAVVLGVAMGAAVTVQAGSKKGAIPAATIELRQKLIDEGVKRRIAALEEETKAKVEFLKAGAERRKAALKDLASKSPKERKQALMKLRRQEKLKRQEFRLALAKKRLAAKQAWMEYAAELRETAGAQEPGEEDDQ